MVGTLDGVRLPYKEAIDFFRQKVNVPSRHWTTLMDQAHARAFAVAGAADDALIGDLRQAVDKAIAEGTGFKAFQKDFDAIVAKHGWVHHGHPQWRARVIYETNMSTAAAAGRYAQATDPDVLAAFPYWEWYHTPVEHPRPQHVAWSGMILRADDPFWDTHYPPCGWGCRCIVMSLSEGDLRRRGKSGPDASPKIEWREYVNKTTGVVTKVPTGVDPGFVGNPGKVWKEGAKAPMVAPKLEPVGPPPPVLAPEPGGAAADPPRVEPNDLAPKVEPKTEPTQPPGPAPAQDAGGGAEESPSKGRPVVDIPTVQPVLAPPGQKAVSPETLTEFLKKPVGSIQVGTLSEGIRDALGALTRAVFLSKDTMDKQMGFVEGNPGHLDLSTSDYLSLPTIIDDPDIVLSDREGCAVYLKIGSKILRAVIRVTKNRRECYLTSLRRARAEDIKREIEKNVLLSDNRNGGHIGEATPEPHMALRFHKRATAG